METTVYPRLGSDRDSAVTAPALAAPVAATDAPPEAGADAVEPTLVPAVFRGGIVPPPFGLLDAQPARASEPASTPAPSALATRQRPDRRTRERAMRKHLHNQAERDPPAQQELLDSTRKITTKSRHPDKGHNPPLAGSSHRPAQTASQGWYNRQHSKAHPTA